MPDPHPQAPILRLDKLVKHYVLPARSPFSSAERRIRAVDGVSLELMPGETVGLVGESGCGKSSLARLVMALETPGSGEVLFEGRNVFTSSHAAMMDYRRAVQMVFQDPYSTLNPRATVGAAITQAWAIHRNVVPRAQWRRKAEELLSLVGLPPERLHSYPHQLSGGQRQRVGIARAIALGPRLVLCDEPVSALDVSVQAQVLDLLAGLQERLGVSYLFISHDLAVVRRISRRIVVMYLGRIVESGSAADIFERTAHPYTEALMHAIPRPDPRRRTLETRSLLQGDPPSPGRLPSGCRFRTRCPRAQPLCAQVEPRLESMDGDHRVACHFPAG